MLEQLDRKNVLAMKLLHYFITEKNYNPIILQGAEDEIWLENLNSDYKIIRIVSNHIINDEQFSFDIYKTKHVLRKIKKKTFTFSLNVLSFYTDLEDDVKIESNKKIDCISLYDIEDLSKYNVVIDAFPDISSKVEFTEEGFQLFMKITSDINKKNKDDSVKVDEVFKPKIPVVTYTIIAINTIIFILMYLADYKDYIYGQFCNWGEGVVVHHEYFRLITGAFLHGDAVHMGLSTTHFLLNMYSLYVIGTQMESYMGKIKYIIIYLFSAFLGSLLSITINGNVASVGASGAIFGLLGSMLYFGYHYRVFLGQVIKSQIIPILLLNLGIGFMIDGIDNSAHIGGLIGGALMTMALGVKYKSTTYEKVNGWIVSIILVIFLLFVAFNYVNYS